MTVRDIHLLLTAWAPQQIAWERDNVGLQIGEMTARVKRILVCLDVTVKVVDEAKKRGANLIISHHPLLFRPPRTITGDDEIGRTIRALLANNINLYAAHTNLDFTRGGTSFSIAEALGLEDVDFLRKSYSVQKKIVTFVPEQHVDRVRNAMAAAGAGLIGNYDHCSFRTSGIGSFRGNDTTHPVVGQTGRLENVPEVRLEMIVNEWDTTNVIRAMRATHPYEEVAYDMYPLENKSDEYGMGIIGTLRRPMRLHPFLHHVKKQLHASMLRATEGSAPSIQRVAACGGSGAELADIAVAQGADAFVTADVKYHDFHHAAGRILLVDAGHYETEHLVVKTVVKRLQTEFTRMGKSLPVSATTLSTNPVYYY